RAPLRHFSRDASWFRWLTEVRALQRVASRGGPMHPRSLTLLLAVTFGCATPDPGTEDVVAVEAPLTSASTATSTELRGAVFFPERHCTGTLIAPRHVLTAIWCQGASTDRVEFYLGSPLPSAAPSNTRTASSETLLTDTHLEELSVGRRR